MSTTLENVGDHRIRVQGEVELGVSRTEARLEIPHHVWVRIAERDDGFDQEYLWANWHSGDAVAPGNDRKTGWFFIDTVVGDSVIPFDFEVDISDLAERGNEEIYMVAASRPDISAAVGNSLHFSRNNELGERFIFPVAEVPPDP
ncbi:MAG: hypothetical protein AAF515_07815 [Pseudomonadota bacterium]